MLVFFSDVFSVLINLNLFFTNFVYYININIQFEIVNVKYCIKSTYNIDTVKFL